MVLVALRISLGFHFLYEGVWKIHHPEFSAEPFLTQAKGPAAPLFYAMLPDLNGRERLRIETNEKGVKVITGKSYLGAWKNLAEKVKAKYRLDDDQKAQVDEIYTRYETVLKAYLAENLPTIEGYFGSLDRFEKQLAEGTNGAAHQQKRDWDRRQELRKEVNGWLSSMDKMGKAYQDSLWRVLKKDQQAEGPLPLPWTMTDLLNFAVTYGLTAIGLCLLLGFCTRLAALGGGAFLISVLLTQPPWPGIYPPAPEVVGHALIVDKNFVEMIALFLVALTAVGRWGGLDYFLYRFLGRPLETWWENSLAQKGSWKKCADEIAMLATSNKPENQFGLVASEKEIRKIGAEISQRWGSNGMRQVWILVKAHPRFGTNGGVAAAALTRIWDGVGEWKC